MLFLAEMPAVVGPEHDDRVLGVRPLLERIEHKAEHRIGKVDRREIALDRCLPLLVFADMVEVAVGATPLSFRRQVIEVIRAVARW